MSNPEERSIRAQMVEAVATRIWAMGGCMNSLEQCRDLATDTLAPWLPDDQGVPPTMERYGWVGVEPLYRSKGRLSLRREPTMSEVDIEALKSKAAIANLHGIPWFTVAEVRPLLDAYEAEHATLHLIKDLPLGHYTSAHDLAGDLRTIINPPSALPEETPTEPAVNYFDQPRPKARDLMAALEESLRPPEETQP